jgi:membrane peptidoglycan carboxypeptidase
MDTLTHMDPTQSHQGQQAAVPSANLEERLAPGEDVPAPLEEAGTAEEAEPERETGTIVAADAEAPAEDANTEAGANPSEPDADEADADATVDNGDGAHAEEAGTTALADIDEPTFAVRLDMPIWVDADSNAPGAGTAACVPSKMWLDPGEERQIRTGRPWVTTSHVRWQIRAMRHVARRRRRTRSQDRLQAVCVALGTMALLVGGAAMVLVQMALSYYHTEAPTLTGLGGAVAGQDSLRIYDAHGTLLYASGNLGVQHSIPLAHIPVTVINATVAIEDRTFWTNPGVDPAGIVRAALADLHADHPAQGASTITQQLIKLQILGDEQTYQRKLHEIILALGLTNSGAYTKSDVLRMYLNSVAYSPLAYGIDAAAQYYFGFSDNPTTGMTAAQHLDLAQASLLAGIPQNPNLNDPFRDWVKARSRQRAVLNAMVADGYITRAQAQTAWQEAGRSGFLHPGGTSDLAPHFVYSVLEELRQMTGMLLPVNLPRSGLNVYTTLDLGLQQHVQQVMQDHLYGNDRDDYGGGLIRNDHLSNSAAILVDHHTGAIKVLLGSENYDNPAVDGNFDVALDGFRGPGSAFKPLVYATAFEKGWFPAAVAADVPTTFYTPNSTEVYRPLDFNPTQFRGDVTLRHALQDSLNIPAVRVMQFAGVNNVRQMAARLGVTQWAQGARWGLSSALGSLDLTVYEMVQAYTVFANYGQFIPLHAIDRITDASGNLVYQFAPPARPQQVLDPRIAFMITSVLSDNPSRADEFGGCSPLYLDPSQADCEAYHFDSPNAWPAAAKTGTGQDFTDDWTLGYTRDYTMGVWAGNDDHTPMYHIDGVTGSAPIWQRSMLYAERALPKRPFPVPASMQRASYCSYGVCTTDWFMAGKLPPSNVGSVAPVEG